MANDNQARPEAGSEDEIAVAARGSCAVITLDRPQALNALTAAMRARLAQAYPRLARDPLNYCVLIRSTSPKAFSAGSDVREILDLAKHDPAAARRVLAEEYSLCWLHECFSKPTISLIDGLVMGGGVGISLYGTHRVAGPGYQFAMPETSIGFFPDDGAAHVFSRMPDGIGVYLGLTGRRIGRADALALGLITHCIALAHFPSIEAALAETMPVDPLLDGLNEDSGPGAIGPHRAAISRCFAAAADLEDIVARLDSEVRRRSEAADWAAGVLGDLKTRSPLALKVTLRHIREAGALDLRLTLARDYRLACHFLEVADFREGVRAHLIDKDRKPSWLPATLAEVSAGMVDRAFEPRPGGELVLPPRQEMQGLRV